LSASSVDETLKCLLVLVESRLPQILSHSEAFQSVCCFSKTIDKFADKKRSRTRLCSYEGVDLWISHAFSFFVRVTYDKKKNYHLNAIDFGLIFESSEFSIHDLRIVLDFLVLFFVLNEIEVFLVVVDFNGAAKGIEL
jgi:hypothetical protein